MLAEDQAVPAAAALALPAEPGGPFWRALLEDRWRARLREVTKLSLAYHQAAAPPNTARMAPPDRGRKIAAAAQNRRRPREARRH